jgi:uncharacterized SAM-binding protein YcdF (DUF218 family)
MLGLLIGRRWPVVLALMTLLISASPLTSTLIWQDLESDYPYTDQTELTQHGAVVVLSGMLTGTKAGESVVSEWGDPDRFFAGVSMLKNGLAEHLIFTRGQMPWGQLPPEGEILRSKAIEMGVPLSQILLTEPVSNTAEEAVAVRAVLEAESIDSIILVTSSFHMPRAKLLFEKQGISVQPFAVDFKAGTSLDWLSVIPSARAFLETSLGIREFIGRLYYYLKYK